MAELLTTKQVQEKLKIDRITIYRMINDGRLKGVKVGNQWRFPESEIDRMLGVETDEELTETTLSIQDFPSGCVKEIQDIFAGIIGIGAVSVTMQGTPLTQPSPSNPFCSLMLASESGCSACQQTWRQIATKNNGKDNFQVCHAGLLYKRSVIKAEDRQVAWLIAGQYYLASPEAEEQEERLRQLAKQHHIPFESLKKAAAQIPVLTKSQQDQVLEWTPKVAGTVQSILCERSDLVNRLRRIAELTSIDTTLSK